MGTRENSHKRMSSAVPVGLRSREYYLNCFTDADRVTRHGDLFRAGDTATDVSEVRYKTGNFTGVCCCNSLCQCYLVYFVSMLVE